MPFDVEAVRSQFPALALTDNGRRRIYFDNPAGTQVPISVASAISACLLNKNANLGGYFATAIAADDVVLSAREAMADFLNAEHSDEIIFGQNMTTMTLHLAQSIGRMLKPGDEIIVSCMDHDANISPWLLLAEDCDLVIKWLPFNRDSFEFDLQDLDELLTDRTRLVCVGGASNLIGTVNDVKTICQMARAAGAMTFIDGVQSAPHLATDVQDIACDFFACSSYKFFGPHQGILWGRRELLQQLEPYKVRPATTDLPWCFETGTQSHEGIAGILATVEYFADIGETMATEYEDRWQAFSGRRRAVHAAMSMLFDYEKHLAKHLINGLIAIDGVTVQGITAEDALDRRVPTVSFTHDKADPDKVAERLARQGVFVWSGHNYALEVVRTLDILDSGGAVRVGPVHYNTVAEIDDLLALLPEVLSD